MIKITSLQKYFNRGKQNEIHVLNDISLELPERGMVAIFGRSGCGKTTLLNVIGGLDSYLSGSVLIDGEKISSNADALRNRHIGYVFQNYNLNSAVNCYDNVADALRLCGMSDKKNAEEMQKRTMSALSAVGMAQYAARYPDTLSGGQKQRIAIARAIVKSPDIILADEPTGNLDEANTVMIMDILREIAETRLVLLVTHEANLVDRYCDRVIGITDGRVTSVKDNDISTAYTARNKNHVYLGEFEKSSSEQGPLSVDYYGEPAEGGIKLTVVNDGGTLFLRIDTPGVHIVDEYGETKLHEGVFEEKEQKQAKKLLDLSLLQPFEGKHYGKLFTFFASLKSGSRILTGKKLRRGKKVLKTRNFLAASYLICFALVFTIMISYCASGVAVYDKASSDINLNTFYVSLSKIDEEALGEALKSESSCVDFINTTNYLTMYNDSIRLSTGVFETFNYTGYDSYTASAPFLPHSLTDNKKLICGSAENLGQYDIVISKATADTLLKTGTYDYISDYEDLIGCETDGSYYNRSDSVYKIVAIVDSDEPAIYANTDTLALILRNSSRLAVWRASDFGIVLNDGEALVADRVGATYVPKKGESFKVSGIQLTATKVESSLSGIAGLYDMWLVANDLSTSKEGTYYEQLESYYSHMHDYAVHNLLAGNNEPWVVSHLIGGNEDALFIGAGSIEYYAACQYRKVNGSFPAEPFTQQELSKYESGYYALAEKCNEFAYNTGYDHVVFYSPTAVFLSDADYAKARFSCGETHPVAISEYYYQESGKYDISMTGYAVLHSYDPDATEAYLRAQFPELPYTFTEYGDISFVSPSMRLAMEIEQERTNIVSSLVSLCVGLALMSVCIYFIMRSSMLSKVREIGIYRAVGVSKKNLIFKFAVESTVVALQTLVIGFAVGAHIASTLASGGVTATVFYFPFWLGVVTLAILVGTCILFGILPIASLLRKTPAQILAKYDI
ncbi:MAG: ATP-binding cassette domain-containing protein [Eubacteriales bacterium]